MGGAGARSDDQRSKLSAEPLVSLFLRRALGYGFVGRLLRDHFGAGGLRSMFRVTADGPVGETLADELREVSALFHGAAVAVGRELGLSRQDVMTDGFRQALVLAGLDAHEVARLGSGDGEDADAQAFREWAVSGDDPDLARDARMMVPVFYDRMRRKTKVWAFLGWVANPLSVGFARLPGVRVTDWKGRDVTAEVDLHFYGRSEKPAYPVTAEVYVEEILDRDRFRALCDRHRTRGEILAHLR